MSRELAIFLTSLIAKDFDSKSKGMDMSSYECELLEKKFIEGKFEEIEKYLSKKYREV